VRHLQTVPEVNGVPVLVAAADGTSVAAKGRRGGVGDDGDGKQAQQLHH
jgi:hypothetical protein